MHRRLRVFIFLVFAVLYTAPWQQSLWAASLKKVLILDFKNLDKNPNYNYLETSITDAVRKNLQEKFAFNEMPQSKWQSLAKDNFFLWAEDNYSRSVGLNLGVRAKQDIVVGGYYQAVRNAYGRYIVRAHVFVLDVGKRKIVTEFSIDMPADATLFDSVEKLATRVVKEAKAVLPNKGDVDFSNIEEDVGRMKLAFWEAFRLSLYPMRLRATTRQRPSSTIKMCRRRSVSMAATATTIFFSTDLPSTSPAERSLVQPTCRWRMT